MKKVIVIGSNAFSGSDFIDLLLEQGHYEVMGISRSPEKKSLFLPYKRHHLKHFQFHQIDLNKDLEKFTLLFKQFRPEYIVNFAAQSEVAPSWDHPHHWFQTNVVALTKLINLIKDQTCLKKYLHISSPEVYGTCKGFITENAPLNPTTPYAASKAAADLSLFTFVKNWNFPLVIIRATNVYGPHQQLFKIIPRSIIYMKQGKKIPLQGGGIAVKSYIHVRDISHGELLAMERGRLGEIYHLSPDKGVAIKEIVGQLAKRLGLIFEDVIDRVPERIGQDGIYTIDSKKAREELEWYPSISLEKGLDQTVNWLENHFEEIKQEPLEYLHKE
ncbi:MAG: GDP-mannose 4,6-dehydratase [Chlamydiales bacterium]